MTLFSCANVYSYYHERYDMLFWNLTLNLSSSSQGVIVLSGMRGAAPRDEWDQDFFDEDDSL